jgi:phage protein D
MPELASLFDIIISGKAAPAELLRDVIEIVVDDNLHLPDMFTLQIHDGELQWVDSELLAIGTEVEIRATAASQGTRSGASAQLIKGEITALAPSFDRTGMPTLLVRGYDRAHRLHRGKRSRSFLRFTDSEIAQRIAREANLHAQVDTTSVIHDYVFQNNQTNLEFLQARAQRLGYEVYVKDKTLYFGQREAEQEKGPELDWGRDLRDFRPRLTTMNQVDEVIVRGWDPKTKKEIVSRVTEGQIAPEVGVAKSGGALTREAFGVAAQAVVVDRPVANVDEAKAMAQALCDELSGDFIQAEGACFGDPRIKAGCQVTIRGVGTRFGGQYFVTSATHTYDENGYETLFRISGRHPDSLTYLLEPKNGADHGWGIVIGLVTNNKDPEGLGRVKVKFPWLAENEESPWARMAVPMGGKDRGFFCMPEINDEVLVAFEHSNIHHPYVLGALWNGKDHPPRRNDQVVDGSGKVNQRIIRSRSGHEIILDDTDGNEQIIIRDKTTKNEIVIDSKNNNMAIKVKGNLTLEAEGEISIQSKRNLKIESKSQLSVESTSNLSIKTKGRGSIKGNTVALDGGPMTEIKGGIVKLN